MISIWNRGFRNSNLDRVKNVNSTEEFADYLQSVHPYFDWIEKKYIHKQKGIPIFRPSFVSDPIDVGTASDNISPLGLAWTRVDTSPIEKANVYDIYLAGAGVETVLLCAQCSEATAGGCNGRGSCGNSTCSCNPGTENMAFNRAFKRPLTSLSLSLSVLFLFDETKDLLGRLVKWIASLHSWNRFVRMFPTV